jgi:hypothetical protein
MQYPTLRFRSYPGYSLFPTRASFSVLIPALLLLQAAVTPAEEVACDPAAGRADQLAAATADKAEIGADDFRISDNGPECDSGYETWKPSVAYNQKNDEYLVVWRGRDDQPGMTPDGTEIFGQRIDAATGVEVGDNDFMISTMGGLGNPDPYYSARMPDVAYNPEANEYLVVWSGSHNSKGQLGREYEIFGQLLDGETVDPIGNAFLISDACGLGNYNCMAWSPAVAYNTVDHEYMVVWTADDEDALLSYTEHEIFGQRLTSTGAEIGVNDFRISYMGGTGDPEYDAIEADITYNPDVNEFLVVWDGDDSTGSLVNGEFEIYCARVPGSSGEPLPQMQSRISDMGGTGIPDYDGVSPAVAYNPTDKEYLVVWSGTEYLIGSEIWGQRLYGANAAEIGYDFAISKMAYYAAHPGIAYLPGESRYLVVWVGSDDSNGYDEVYLVEGEDEVFGQYLSGDGSEIGDNDFRISTVGPHADDAFDAERPAVAARTKSGEQLVVWDGLEVYRCLGQTTSWLDDDIYGQRLLF